jgi:hypothetical protein
MGERAGQKRYWWREERAAATSKAEDAEDTVCLLRAPKPGDVCPTCGRGTLDYDSLFMLVCDACGEVADAGCFS